MVGNKPRSFENRLIMQVFSRFPLLSSCRPQARHIRGFARLKLTRLHIAENSVYYTHCSMLGSPNSKGWLYKQERNQHLLRPRLFYHSFVPSSVHEYSAPSAHFKSSGQPRRPHLTTRFYLSGAILPSMKNPQRPPISRARWMGKGKQGGTIEFMKYSMCIVRNFKICILVAGSIPSETVCLMGSSDLGNHLQDKTQFCSQVIHQINLQAKKILGQCTRTDHLLESSIAYRAILDP